MSGIRVFWGLLVVSLGITIGLWLFMREGVGPQPVRHIKLSSFASAKEASNAIFLKLRPQMLKQDLFILGIPGGAESGLPILKQFQADLPRYLESPFIFLLDEDLEKLYPQLSEWSGQRINPRNMTSKAGLEEIKGLLNKGIKLAILTQVHNAYSETEGFARLWKDENLGSFNLIMARLSRSKDHEQELYPTCRTGFEGTDPLTKLGCLILQTARLNYRRKADAKEFTGLMVQISDRDQLFLVR